jgi:geranylgeranyl diphosphate synthase type II
VNGSLEAVEVLERYAARVEEELTRVVPEVGGALETLHEAMRYSLLAGGKRLRPALCFASCEAVGGSLDDAAGPAAALELVHTYSLIHDDLPCMDDDDLRRGRPTSHRVYGEAMAVLAGDGLLTRAFGVLAECSLPAEARIRAVHELAEAAGAHGMVGGQALDLAAEGSEVVDLPTLQYIHTHKTGALIGASCRLGGIAGGADPGVVADLGRFGEKIGLAFQIVDDLLDETADAATLGKAAHKDRSRGKATYPRLLGLGESRDRVRELGEEADRIAAAFGEPGRTLELLARFVVSRTH